MIELNTGMSRPNKTGFSGKKKVLLRIDMTPMVDLGFLLITFFVFTTTISNPTVTNLIMPDDEPTAIPSELPESLSLTILIGENDRVYYYQGKWEGAVKSKSIYETSFSYSNGIGEVIRKRQKELDVQSKNYEGRRGLMLIIKPGENASCGNVVDVLDEVMINDVKKYALVEPEQAEIDYINNKRLN